MRDRLFHLKDVMHAAIFVMIIEVIIQVVEDDSGIRKISCCFRCVIIRIYFVFAVALYACTEHMKIKISGNSSEK